MDCKDFIHLYQKLIESHSPQNQLFNTRQYKSLLSNESFTPSMIADIRYSEEYLSLLTTQKAFNSTYESLTYLYNHEKGLKNNKKNLSAEYQEWMFEKIFTNKEKQVIQAMVSKEFGGNHGDTKNKKRMPEENIHQNQQNKKDKNLFCQMLELIFYEDQISRKNKEKIAQNDEQKPKRKQQQFSVGKILNMML